MVFGQFSRKNTYVSITWKLSQVHLHTWLFSNSCGNVLIIVGISWSPHLVVQNIYFLYKKKYYPWKPSCSNFFILMHKYKIQGISNHFLYTFTILTKCFSWVCFKNIWICQNFAFLHIHGKTTSSFVTTKFRFFNIHFPA